MTFDLSKMIDGDPTARPAEAVMQLLRRNQEALLTAADFALRVVPESYRSGTSEQRAVVVLDMSEPRARRIVQIGVEVGVVPPIAASEQTDAMIMVVPVDAARKLVEDVSSIPIDRFDDAACYSTATRGMMLVVLSCGATFLGCLPRSGAEIARA